MTHFFLLLALCVLAASSINLGVDAENVSGSESTSDNFIFLAKFAVSKDTKGSVTFNGDFPNHNSKDTSILLAYTASAWSDAKDDSCADAVKKANFGAPVPSIKFKDEISLTTHESAEYWYFAVANCSLADGQDSVFDWSFEFLNGNSQFSYDLSGVVYIYLLFSIVFLALTCGQIYAAYVFTQQNQFHPILRLLTIAIVLEFISLLVLFVNYVVYIENGSGIEFMVSTGLGFDLVSTVVFMLVLILIAKGWSISTFRLTRRKVLAAFFGMFVIAYALFFVWSQFALDPASSSFVYQSIPGIIVVVLRLMTFAYFLYELVLTFREEQQTEKRSFYVKFGITYSLWFLSLPIVVAVAMVLPEWYREKLVVLISTSITTLAYGILAFLMWPSRVTKFFTIAPPDLLGGTGGGASYDVL
eukprot:TRINITY_DN6500_c0_g1_i1.p1 TRINITY_DN6500_c0_g1~~TRINITY_DN6500_c0_g1_i1.p1  ORF type:complete len:416 (+),score=99.10 TRINITY_DN6500_c0_g1_i1:152-1399(+)